MNTDSADLFHTHSLSRFLFGIGFLVLASACSDSVLSLFLSVLSMMMIRYIDGSCQTIRRLAGLLIWFFVPILLLHAFFSPGQLLFPGGWLSITVEGLHRGFQLCAHLMAVFLTAMMMFRLLKHGEWLTAVAGLPYVGRRLLPLLWMIVPMKNIVLCRLGVIKQQYQLRNDWRLLPQLLLSACSQVLLMSGQVASALWLRWPAGPFMAGQSEIFNKNSMAVDALLMIAGTVALLLVWV